jgi:predicted nucleic acid-binding protein
VTDFIIDASAALAWLVPTQATAASTAFLQERDADRFVVPHIFNWEVGNALLALHRRRLLPLRELERAFADLSELEVVSAPAMPTAEIEQLGLIGRELGLSLFDSAYLTLAMERSAALVSRDGGLLAVAGRQRVDCIDLRRP